VAGDHGESRAAAHIAASVAALPGANGTRAGSSRVRAATFTSLIHALIDGSHVPKRADAARLAGPAGLVVGAFAVSRMAAYGAGVRFDASPLGYFWQIVDADLLRSRLLESLYHLHSQPPGFNALLGVVLGLFPERYELALAVLYLLVGLAFTIALYLLLHLVAGIERWTSAAVSAVVCASPPWLTYENWLFYEYPAGMLLAVSALLLWRFLRRGTTRAGLVFFGAVAALVWFRSAFQPLWLALVVLLLVLCSGGLRSRAARTSAVAIGATLLLVGKNLVVFGVPSTSSWLGMNLAEVVYSQVPPDERRALVARGELSRVSLEDPFSPPADYVALLGQPRPRGVPVLDRLGTDENPNMNHAIFLDVSEKYLADSVRLIRLRPRAYATAVWLSLGLYARPPTESIYVAGNRERLGVYSEIAHRALFLQVKPGEPAWAIVLSHTLALLYGLRLTYRLLRQRIPSSPAAVTLAYMWLTLVYVTAATSLVQIVENNRIRFLVDAFALVLLAAAAREALGWARARRAARSAM